MSSDWPCGVGWVTHSFVLHTHMHELQMELFDYFDFDLSNITEAFEVLETFELCSGYKTRGSGKKLVINPEKCCM